MQKITASDVAEKAGVSKWTVSRAFTEGAYISPSARERVLKAAQDLGYRPNLLARSLTKKRSQIVGLVVDELDNPNLMTVLNEVTHQLQCQGYMSMILNISGEHSHGSALSLADQFQVDGLIFLGTVLSEELVRLALEIRHIPLIVMCRYCENPGIQVVATDDIAAGAEIADVFIGEGYQRIGYMGGPSNSSTHLLRFNGFRDRLNPHGLAVSDVLKAEHFCRENGLAVLRQYLDRTPAQQRMEALFCENDVLAIGAMDALYERGEQGSIAIIGFDGTDQAASPRYQLSTYRQPLSQLVSESIRRLSDDGKSDPDCFLATGQLILRSSHIRTR